MDYRPLYPFIYGFTSCQYPNGSSALNRVYATLPTLPNKPRIKIEFVESPITKRKMKATWLEGHELPLNTSIEELTFTSEVLATKKLVYDTTSEFFHKLNCIKTIRYVTGCGLAEAKGMVEAFQIINAEITVLTHQELKWP